jgi:hypothetical protein
VVSRPIAPGLVHAQRSRDQGGRPHAPGASAPRGIRQHPPRGWRRHRHARAVDGVAARDDLVPRGVTATADERDRAARFREGLRALLADNNAEPVASPRPDGLDPTARTDPTALSRLSGNKSENRRQRALARGGPTRHVRFSWTGSSRSRSGNTGCGKTNLRIAHQRNTVASRVPITVALTKSATFSARIDTCGVRSWNT